MFNLSAFYRALSPEGTRGGEFRGNFYVRPFVCPSICPYVCPPRLISGGLRLPRGFPEAGSGFSEGSLSPSHYGTEQPDCGTSKTHFPTSLGVSERASEGVSTAERTSEASSAEQANK